MSPKVQPSRFLVYIAPISAITLWGMSYLWTNRLIELQIPIFYFVFVRILLAGLILFLFNAAYGRIKRMQKNDIPKFVVTEERKEETLTTYAYLDDFLDKEEKENDSGNNRYGR